MISMTCGARESGWDLVTMETAMAGLNSVDGLASMDGLKWPDLHGPPHGDRAPRRKGESRGPPLPCLTSADPNTIPDRRSAPSQVEPSSSRGR
jgi:hypothetical protein